MQVLEFKWLKEVKCFLYRYESFIIIEDYI